jgi:hypothetical protein
MIVESKKASANSMEKGMQQARDYRECMKQFPDKVIAIVSTSLLRCQSPFMKDCLTEKVVLKDGIGEEYAFCMGPHAESAGKGRASRLEVGDSLD